MIPVISKSRPVLNTQLELGLGAGPELVGATTGVTAGVGTGAGGCFPDVFSKSVTVISLMTLLPSITSVLIIFDISGLLRAALKASNTSAVVFIVPNGDLMVNLTRGGVSFEVVVGRLVWIKTLPHPKLYFKPLAIAV